MTAVKLRNYLTKRISRIDDLDFLNAIRVILESREDLENIYRLSDFEKKKVRKSKLQFKKGLGVPNEKVFDEIVKWLKEK